MNNETEQKQAVFQAPENNLGILCYHTHSGKPIDESQLKDFIEKVVTPVAKEVESELEKELSTLLEKEILEEQSKNEPQIKRKVFLCLMDEEEKLMVACKKLEIDVGYEQKTAKALKEAHGVNIDNEMLNVVYHDIISNNYRTAYSG